jgi:hypothetical protein
LSSDPADAVADLALDIDNGKRIGHGAPECERTVASGMSQGWSSHKLRISLALNRGERTEPVGPTAAALARSQEYPLLGQPPDHLAPSVMALLVHLITRRPYAFLMPLVDGAKRNIEQPRNLISREPGFRLSTGLFAGLRHVYRSGCGGWAVWIRAGPHHRHKSISGPRYAFVNRRARRARSAADVNDRRLLLDSSIMLARSYLAYAHEAKTNG